MKIEIYSVGMRVGDRLEERIEQKLEKFHRYFDDAAECQVKLSEDGPNLRRVEITVFVKKHIYRAERSAENIITALDLTISILEGQIRKQKTKLRKRKKDYAYLKDFFSDEENLLNEDEEFAEGDEEILNGQTFKYKSFPLSPMSREEAALQMELLGHSFYLYTDTDSGNVNLVYKRKNGDYGIIDPEY